MTGRSISSDACEHKADQIMVTADSIKSGKGRVVCCLVLWYDYSILVATF